MTFSGGLAPWLALRSRVASPAMRSFFEQTAKSRTQVAFSYNLCRLRQRNRRLPSVMSIRVGRFESKPVAKFGSDLLADFIGICKNMREGTLEHAHKQAYRPTSVKGKASHKQGCEISVQLRSEADQGLDVLKTQPVTTDEHIGHGHCCDVADFFGRHVSMMHKGVFSWKSRRTA